MMPLFSRSLDTLGTFTKYERPNGVRCIFENRFTRHKRATALRSGARYLDGNAKWLLPLVDRLIVIRRSYYGWWIGNVLTLEAATEPAAAKRCASDEISWRRGRLLVWEPERPRCTLRRWTRDLDRSTE